MLSCEKSGGRRAGTVFMMKLARFFIDKRKRIFLLLLDSLAICCCFAISWTVIVGERLDKAALIYIAENCVLSVLLLALFKTYKSIWRYAQMRDYIAVALGVFCANLLCFLFNKLTHIPDGVQRIVNDGTDRAKLYYVFALFSCLACMLTLIIMRMVYRTLYDVKKTVPAQTEAGGGMRTLIVGAGQACWLLLSEIQHAECEYNVVGIVDDDKSKIGRKIDSISIYGPIENIKALSEKLTVDVIIIAIPSAGKEVSRRIVGLCNDTGCDVRVIPEIHNIVDRQKLMSLMRKIDAEDLLGRTPVVLDVHESERLIGNKTVMVTGGGGSIGSELCRQIMHYSPKLLVVVDIYENNAYDIQQELIDIYGSDAALAVRIASVRDYGKMEALFAQYSPQVVFHAAAHKHVPLMESDPEEAVKNNIAGTYNVAELSGKFGVERFVLISSDKAVNPTNVMGATKRFCEMIVQHFAAVCDGTEYCAVRFGNVLGSNGSVVPLFNRLIDQKKDLPVTHPDITRYFMTIPEAVSLVLRAGAMAHGGEIFVLDMGEPVKIADLARNLIRLKGYVPDRDIKIKYVGLRPGEKLYEETLMGGKLKSTYHDKIFIEETDKIDGDKLMADYAAICDRAGHNDSENVVSALLSAVPTYERHLAKKAVTL